MKWSKMKVGKRITGVLIAFTLACCLLPRAAAAGFPDVKAGDWAEAYISKAAGLGIMGGYDNGEFGYGDKVTRAQFAAMLVRLFRWERVSPDSPVFGDNQDKAAWYYGDIETAVKNGAVPAEGGKFRPGDAITREEMAVMLVRGLGYSTLAGSLKSVTLPFSDVSANAAYIEIAYDFGIITGTTPSTFEPSGSATRAQAAAMMVRLYDRYFSKLNWSHAFYAVKAYSQRDMIPDFNTVSFGWSRMELDSAGAPTLNTAVSNGNTYGIPAGYQEVVQLAKAGGVKDHLDVYMSAAQEVTLPDGSATDACTAILTDPGRRTQAVAQIVAELQRENSYTGVTIDFEEMWGDALKNGFSAFVQELKTLAEPLGMSLYVCVAPVTSDGRYYNAYDYRAVGTYADKVILMAHDYAANTLTAADMNAGFTTTPVTPFYEIYAALRAVCDPLTGVQDRSKLALAVSFSSVQWKMAKGKVTNQAAARPEPPAIYSRLLDPTAVLNFSDKYRDPYITYHNSADNSDNIIWYEDVRSIDAKMDLAKMFGITGISFWRLGLIPAYADSPDRQIFYDIPSWLAAQK
jgi:spore germination protein YaaH